MIRFGMGRGRSSRPIDIGAHSNSKGLKFGNMEERVIEIEKNGDRR